MPLSEESVREALTTVKFPGLSRDIVSFGFLDSVAIDAGKVTLRLSIPTGSPAHQERIAEDAHTAVAKIEGVTGVRHPRLQCSLLMQAPPKESYCGPLLSHESGSSGPGAGKEDWTRRWPVRCTASNH